ncbi:MAG TPA: septum formation initiator family protein [Candidatus Blautia excrementipullorum]|nr:septum formation initiator family protein [Candidatus Blautia excrementipullorum]
MAAISVVAVILLGSLAVESVNMRNRVAVYDARAAELEEKIENEKERTKEIDAQKEYMETDEYAAEVARDRLGLVKENETVFEEEK